MPETLFLALAAAESAVSRLDEQVRLSPVGDGWRARLDFQEAADWSWTRNELAPLEDLVLHDAELDVRIPTQALSRAYGLVRARQRAGLGSLDVLRPDAALWLTSRGDRPPLSRIRPPPHRPLPHETGLVSRLGAALEGLSVNESETPLAGLQDWGDLMGRLEAEGPDLLTAAVGLEAWRLIRPLPREDHMGAILVAVWLKGRKRVASHLVGLQGAERAIGPLPSPIGHGHFAGRLEFHLRALRAAAEIGQEELRRLGLVHALLARQTAGRRGGSRARDLADLLIALPVVSAPLAAARLGISQQAVRSLIPTLGSAVQELTGRRRFQAWRV